MVYRDEVPGLEHRETRGTRRSPLEQVRMFELRGRVTKAELVRLSEDLGQ